MMGAAIVCTQDRVLSPRPGANIEIVFIVLRQARPLPVRPDLAQGVNVSVATKNTQHPTTPALDQPGPKAGSQGKLFPMRVCDLGPLRQSAAQSHPKLIPEVRHFA
jgi:hypothetical protein